MKKPTFQGDHDYKVLRGFKKLLIVVSPEEVDGQPCEDNISNNREVLSAVEKLMAWRNAVYSPACSSSYPSSAKLEAKWQKVDAAAGEMYEALATTFEKVIP